LAAKKWAGPDRLADLDIKSSLPQARANWNTRRVCRRMEARRPPTSPAPRGLWREIVPPSASTRSFRPMSPEPRPSARTLSATGIGRRRTSVFSAGARAPSASIAGWIPREISRSSSSTLASPSATRDDRKDPCAQRVFVVSTDDVPELPQRACLPGERTDCRSAAIQALRAAVEDDGRWQQCRHASSARRCSQAGPGRRRSL
jgi:hypothetical protein